MGMFNKYEFRKSRFIFFFAIQTLTSSCVLTSLNLFAQNGVVAQVVPDQTLGAESSLTNSNADINGIPSTLIEGGAKRGANLFHSFEKFSVEEGRGAYFNNPDGIQRILSRVTGNSISEILGTLGVLGNADLFLINPNGIILGSKASLDLKGSFLATTATSLIFEDGTEFSAKVSSTPSLLTVSIPVGLQFREPIGDIVQQPTSSLESQTGKTLALVGGNVNILGGYIFFPAGRIELGSVAGTGYVSLHPIQEGWALSYEGVQNFGDIQIIQGASFDVTNYDFSSQNLGDIQLQGRNITVKDGSQISGSQGTIKVGASETLAITGFQSYGPNLPIVRSGFGNFSLSDKNAGSITINTKKLIVQDGGVISTSSIGLNYYGTETIASGKGGNLIINASESVELTGKSGVPTGLSSETESFGAGGNITINTKKLTVQGGAEISTATTAISSFGQSIVTGTGGDINIIASDSINVSGGILSTETSGFGGNAGNIKIETGHLNLNDSASILASSSGQRKGGNILVDALQLNLQNGSQISASSRFSQGGNISLKTGQLNVAGRAKVSVSSPQGQAGNLNITTNSLTLNRGSITAETGKSGAGSGANITLQLSDFVRLENGSLISATANGNANGGNITINSPIVFAFPSTTSNGSDIIAKAENGDGGNIQINAQGIFGIAENLATSGNKTNDIDASSQFGASGQVQLKSTIDPNQGVIQLPETVVDPNTLVAQNPCKRGSQSQFTRTGRGGLPLTFKEDLTDEVTQVRLVQPASSDMANETAQKNSSHMAQNARLIRSETEDLQPIVPAQGWMFNQQGQVVLLAYDPNVTGPQRVKENLPGCPVP
jgi:filamentous hemagglutinin family protein